MEVMQTIDPGEYEKRRQRIEDIFANMVRHADVQILTRCPYKNKDNRCTAKFGCRNKRKPQRSDPLSVCVSDDRLDYRSAWETAPQSYGQVKTQLQMNSSTREKQGDVCGTSAGEMSRVNAEPPASPARPVPEDGTVSYDGVCRPSFKGKKIFDYADEIEVRVPTSCGRTGICHECIIEVRQGMQSLCERTEAEAFLRENYRLACQAAVEDTAGDVEFTLLRRTPKILTKQTRRNVQLDPAVTRDGEQVFYRGELIDKYRGRMLGLAIDVGTTTVVLELVDLETGEEVFNESFENPQRFGGSDIMNRISYDAGDFNGELHNAFINTLNTEIRGMCAESNITRHVIYEIVIVGNATMRDLCFGLNVQPIGQKPYKSMIEHEVLDGKRKTTTLCESARRLRIAANKNARVWGAPLIASHVGGDVVADLVAIDMVHQTGTVMLVDAGTNTEVVIGNKDRLLAASCPAGPAFEGGLVTYGMPGCEGAIETLRFERGNGDQPPSGFAYETIGDAPPQGLCGSGLIDLIAELRRNDMMTPKGVFADKANRFDIVPEQGITFSRNDASELAQAKAANYCGQIILMRKFGVTPETVDKLYLAGGFANYVDVQAAIDIGFLAPVPVERIEKVGNAAAQGARELMLSQTKRDEIEQLIKNIEHVELETMEDFFDVFVEGCQFKPMTFH